jgi:hypothetical protein
MSRYFVAILIAVFAALLFALPGIAGAADGDRGRSVHIVSFADAPIASFRGLPDGVQVKGHTLKATSPAATGRARLDMQSLEVRAYRAFLAEQRAERLALAEQRLGRPLPPEFVYDVASNAVALALDAEEAAALAALPGIAAVEPEAVHELHSDVGPRWIGAEAVWDGSAGVASRGAGRVIAILDTGINPAHPSFAAVGPVDGHVHVNPKGRFFGQCVGNSGRCNAKLIGIHDFTVCSGATNFDGCEDKNPNDGSDVDGHGSHVASTAVGNMIDVDISPSLGGGDGRLRLSGVAPHANLISYKVCETNCPGRWTLAGVDQAVADGVDVINYSIGGDPRSPWSDATARAMLAARDANVMVVSSAGNGGPAARSVSSPADAPWVLAVANSSHDRAVVNRLIGLAGGASAPPAGGVLIGAGQTAGVGPRPLVVPTDHPGCSIGNDIDFPPSGVSNPWSSSSRFNGEIVVCLRGTQARVAKSNNVRLAGGGGMVLLNLQADGEGVMADQHSIPSTHLGYSDGQALLQWLGSGSGHQGRIEGARILYDAALADRLSHSSSRGPVYSGEFLKPAVAAPGSSVLAADSSGSEVDFKSGTSMASPHVAGAAILLKAARPGWTVSDIESALVTSALPAIRAGGSDAPAALFEQGAGRIDVGRALRAGISFPVTRAEFDAANPAIGGSTRDLNQPAVVHGRCFGQCSLTRRVRDIAGGGQWRVEVSAEDGFAIEVSPSEFSLAAGASRDLHVTMRIDSPALLGRYAEGALILRRIDGSADSVTPARVPVAAFADPGALPARLDVTAAAERGHVDASLGGLAALADLRVSAAPPAAAPLQASRVLAQDPEPGDPYDGGQTGRLVQYLQVPAQSGGLFRLLVEARSPTANNIKLYVGIDRDGDGLPSAAERLCRSASPGRNERCELDIPGSSQPQTVWMLVQNAQAQGGSDSVSLEALLFDLTPADPLRALASGPASAAAGAALPLRVGWDLPELMPGRPQVSLLQLAIGDRLPFAEVPVWFNRTATAPAPRTLVPARSQSLRLAAGVAHEQLIVDVPANASALVLRTLSPGSIDLYAAHVATPAGPALGQAPPRAQAQVSAVGGSGSKTLRIEGSQLQTGRWYVTPVNTGNAEAALTVSATLEYGAARTALVPGAYFNPDRSGAGAFLYEIGDAWGFIWYAYLQDGTPTWYLGAAPKPSADQGVWRVPLDRYVWNGSEAIPTRVGEAILAFSEPQAFQFGWNLDGQSGSERYVRIDTGSCPQPGGVALDADGIWFSPERPGFGYSVNVGSGIETHAAYLYDARGIARWLFGSVAPFGAAGIPMQAHFGACPLCPYQAPTTQAAGMLTRSYASGGASGQISTQFSLPAPLAGSWQIDLPAVRMTDAVGCNP